MRYAFLHGFAAAPFSAKGRFFHERFAARGIPLLQPDLNAPSFEKLTLTGQLEVLAQALDGSDDPVTLIGSSMGALVATLQAARDERVTRLVLLAPAFQFFQRWLSRLGPEEAQAWEARGWMTVPHFAYGRPCNLHFDILRDAQQYDEAALTRPLPTLIFHGRQDALVNPAVSVSWAASRPWVRLELLESDHGLLDQLEVIWAQAAAFCDIPL